MSWLVDPWTSDLVARAGVELVVIGALGGALGVFVVLRGMSYSVEAFAHAVLPGAVVAAAAGASIVAGGMAAALAAAAAIALATLAPRISADTAVGVVFTGMFATGVLLASALGPLNRDLSSFLFGSLLGVSTGDVTLSIAAAATAGVVLVIHRRALIAGLLDREAAQAAGLPARRARVALYALVAVAVVISVRAVGNVLVLALFVTPAASARLVCRRIGATIAAAVAFGVAAGLAGLYASYHGRIATGGSVVLVATGLLALTWLASPRAGLVAAARRARTARPARS